jgi:hypothetical protein
MKILKDIVDCYRNSGNTTWILKSAIENPNVIIVFPYRNSAKMAQQEYYRLLKEHKETKILPFRIKKQETHPIFAILTEVEQYIGIRPRRSIIFDNSVFYYNN